MLITADWVLPISRSPIRNGAVLVERGRIVEVGRAEQLIALAPDAKRHEFGGCALMPGLVNAHTHLSLSALEGLLEPDAFDRWLPRIVTAMGSWRHDDYAASAKLGASRCIEAGVTVVGDIAYGPESAAAAGDAGLGGVFYWEVLGVEGPRLFSELERMEFPLDQEGLARGRVRCGLSPHSAYTSGPSLLRSVHKVAGEMHLPVAIHVAESAAEAELLNTGTGPLAETAQRLAHGFVPPKSGTVAYLDRLGTLDGATAVHLGHTLPTDIPRLAATVRGVVTCPRSNRYLSNRLPRISRMLSAGIPVGIGTDSSASNHDLDLFEDARALHSADPQIPAGKILEMLTAMGAIVLGVEDQYGVLETGMQADIAVFRIGESDSPEEDLLANAGREALEALLSGGVWRVSDSRIVRRLDDAACSAIETATKRARVSLDAQQ